MHAVDTRPSFPLPPIRRPGDEARGVHSSTSAYSYPSRSELASCHGCTNDVHPDIVPKINEKVVGRTNHFLEKPNSIPYDGYRKSGNFRCKNIFVVDGSY